MILAGRRINDGMGAYIANRVMKLLTKKGSAQNAKILILGITFKEDCPDIRNSRVIDVIEELKDYGVALEVYDPHADKAEVKDEYGIDLVDAPGTDYSAVVLAVKHKAFENLDWSSIKGESTAVFDVKSGLEKNIISERL